MEIIATKFDCKVGQWPTSYLGFLLHDKPSSISFWIDICRLCKYYSKRSNGLMKYKPPAYLRGLDTLSFLRKLFYGQRRPKAYYYPHSSKHTVVTPLSTNFHAEFPFLLLFEFVISIWGPADGLILFCS